MLTPQESAVVLERLSYLIKKVDNLLTEIEELERKLFWFSVLAMLLFWLLFWGIRVWQQRCCLM